MDHIQTFRRCFLDAFVAILRQRYPASRLIIVEDRPEQAVIQLDQFTVTIINQGMVEVAAPTNSHQRVEQLATEIAQLLSQASSDSQEHVGQ